MIFFSNIAINLFFLFLLFAWFGFLLWKLILRYIIYIISKTKFSYFPRMTHILYLFPGYHGASSSTDRQQSFLRLHARIGSTPWLRQIDPNPKVRFLFELLSWPGFKLSGFEMYQDSWTMSHFP